MAARFALLSWLFSGFLATHFPLIAQTTTFSSVNLPTSADVAWITDLKQDQQGYIWMATFTGVHRYNGYEWSSYFRNPHDPNGDDNSLESVCPTRDGLVWVGTQGLGLDCLDPETGQFRHYFLEHHQKLNKAENFISVLCEGRDGTLWVGTYNGLYSRNPKTGQFTHYPNHPGDPHSLSHPQVRSICEDRSGAIWVGTGEPTETTPQEGGLNKLDRRTGRFSQYRHDPADPNSLSDNRVRTILEDRRGTLWVGTWGDGLHTMDRRTGKFTRHRYNPAQPQGLSRPYLKNHKGEANWGISFIKEDPAGDIWIGAYAGGLNCYNPRTGQVTHYDAEQGGVENSQWSMCVSRDGVLWLGSASGKLMKGVRDKKLIPFQGTTSSLGVNTFYEEATGKALLGTYAGLKNHQFGNDSEEPLLWQAARQTTLLTDPIQSFYKDRQENLWISTLSSGLYSYNPKRERFTNFLRDSSHLDAKLNVFNYLGGDLLTVVDILQKVNSVMGTYEDRAGAFWVMTGHGLHKLDRQTGRLTPYRHHPGDSTTLSRGITVGALEDHTGQFWVGSSGGLNRMDRQKGTFTRYLKGEYIAQLGEDAAGTLWVATGRKNLFRFDRQTNTFTLFIDPASGMPVANVKCFVEDGAQNLWVGTDTGIVRINQKRDSINVFGPGYGFRGYSSILLGSAFKSRDGSLLFGGEYGYYQFQPDQLMALRPPPPPLVLSTFLVANQPVGPQRDGPLSEPINRAQTIHLAHNQHTFAFDFVAFDYRHPERVQYSYFLENYEVAWRPVGTERRGSYYNVPPGKYVFRVKAGNSDSGWTEKAITVVIDPPWWQTWWAYTLFAFLAGAALWGTVQYRSRALRRENAQLEEKVALRTDQLQKSLDDLRKTQTQLVQAEKMASLGELTAGIAHEIQNPLNFVNNFSEVSTELIDELKEGPLQQLPQADKEYVDELLGDLTQNLQKITLHGGRASSIVKGMLEHSRTTTGERQPTDLNALCEEYLRLAYHGLRAKNKDFNAELKTDFDPDLGQVEVVSQEIGRVLLNLFNNAFYAVSAKNKQHPEGYQPTVSVTTSRAGNSIEIRVRDNGMGIPDGIKQKIFQPFFTTKPTGEGTGLGLSLAYDIITKGHGGALQVDSKEGEFTQFVITLPTA